MKFYPEGWLINTPENQYILKDSVNLIDAINESKIVEAKAIVCDKNHNLIVDLGCMKGIVKREDSAVGIKEGTTKDIAIISRVNKPICFIVKEIISAVSLFDMAVYLFKIIAFLRLKK